MKEKLFGFLKGAAFLAGITAYTFVFWLVVFSSHEMNYSWPPRVFRLFRPEPKIVRVEPAPKVAYFVPTNPRQVERQPLELRLYTFNTAFAGARVSVNNHRQPVLWGTIPVESIRRTTYDYDGSWRQQIFIPIPVTTDLTQGFDLTVHFVNGTVTRFQADSFPTDFEPWAYLHICGSSLRPHAHISWGEEGELHPESEIRVPTHEEIAAQMKG